MTPTTNIHSFEVESLEMDHFIDGILESFSDEILLTQLIFSEAQKNCPLVFYISSPLINTEPRNLFDKDFEPPLHRNYFKQVA